MEQNKVNVKKLQARDPQEPLRDLSNMSCDQKTVRLEYKLKVILSQ